MQAGGAFVFADGAWWQEDLLSGDASGGEPRDESPRTRWLEAPWLASLLRARPGGGRARRGAPGGRPGAASRVGARRLPSLGRAPRSRRSGPRRLDRRPRDSSCRRGRPRRPRVGPAAAARPRTVRQDAGLRRALPRPEQRQSPLLAGVVAQQRGGADADARQVEPREVDRLRAGELVRPATSARALRYSCRWRAALYSKFSRRSPSARASSMARRFLGISCSSSVLSSSRLARDRVLERVERLLVDAQRGEAHHDGVLERALPIGLEAGRLAQRLQRVGRFGFGEVGEQPRQRPARLPPAPTVVAGRVAARRAPAIAGSA